MYAGVPALACFVDTKVLHREFALSRALQQIQHSAEESFDSVYHYWFFGVQRDLPVLELGNAKVTDLGTSVATQQHIR